MYRFPCGCEFSKLDFDNLNLNCPAVWQMLADGLVKGCFQLESQLGKSWCKKLRPEEVEHLSALVAILRPGVLNAKDDKGVSVAEHYCKRKNKEEPVEYLDSKLIKFLQATYGTLIYQEQTLNIAKEICGFTPTQADSLRKGIGKKKADIVSKCRAEFIDGGNKLALLNDDKLRILWENIEKSNRYQFNRAHSMSYGMECYWSAYTKIHFPLHFFKSYLKYAHEKIDPHEEVRDLINEAKLMNIEVLGPTLTSPEARFHISGKTIRFGLCDVKGIGESAFNKLRAELDAGMPPSSWNWIDFLYFSRKLSTTTAKALILAGAVPVQLPRIKMLYEYKKWCDLTNKEQEWCIDQHTTFNSFVDLLTALAPTKKNGGGTSNVNRSAFVESMRTAVVNPPYPMVDSAEWVASVEEDLMGVALTASRLEERDTAHANCTCREFVDGRSGMVILAVEIDGVREILTKKKQPMAFLSVKDATCAINDVVVFSDAYSQYNQFLQSGNTVLLGGKRDSKTSQLITEKVWQI